MGVLIFGESMYLYLVNKALTLHLSLLPYSYQDHPKSSSVHAFISSLNINHQELFAPSSNGKNFFEKTSSVLKLGRHPFAVAAPSTPRPDVMKNSTTALRRTKLFFFFFTFFFSVSSFIIGHQSLLFPGGQGRGTSMNFFIRGSILIGLNFSRPPLAAYSRQEGIG